MTAAAAPSLALDQAWEVAPMVALRPEPFGALAYHFGTRRLTFLKRRDLADVVSCLGDHPDAASALLACDIPAESHKVYAEALATLAEAGMIQARISGESHDQH